METIKKKQIIGRLMDRWADADEGATTISRELLADAIEALRHSVGKADADAEDDFEIDHGETVLRVQKALGITDTGWVSPDVVIYYLKKALAGSPAVQLPTRQPADAAPVEAVSFVPQGYENETEFLRQQLKDARNSIKAYQAVISEHEATIAAQAAPAKVVESTHHLQQAACWRAFERVRRTNDIQGAGHGRRFKIVEICPVTGDETEFDGFETAIRALAAPTEHLLRNKEPKCTN